MIYSSTQFDGTQVLLYAHNINLKLSVNILTITLNCFILYSFLCLVTMLNCKLFL